MIDDAPGPGRSPAGSPSSTPKSSLGVLTELCEPAKGPDDQRPSVADVSASLRCSVAFSGSFGMVVGVRRRPAGLRVGRPDPEGLLESAFASSGARARRRPWPRCARKAMTRGKRSTTNSIISGLGEVGQRRRQRGRTQGCWRSRAPMAQLDGPSASARGPWRNHPDSKAHARQGVSDRRGVSALSICSWSEASSPVRKFAPSLDGAENGSRSKRSLWSNWSPCSRSTAVRRGRSSPSWPRHHARRGRAFRGPWRAGGSRCRETLLGVVEAAGKSSMIRAASAQSSLAS